MRKGSVIAAKRYSSRFASFVRWFLMRNITGIHANLGTEYLHWLVGLLKKGSFDTVSYAELAVFKAS
jgi:hypothetical protein